MFIGNDCLDSIPVSQNFVRIPGYISNAVRILRAKHHQLLLQLNTEPEFLLHGISMKGSQQVIKFSDSYSKMNGATELKKAV